MVSVQGAGLEVAHHWNIGIVRAGEGVKIGLRGGHGPGPPFGLHPALDQTEGSLFDNRVGRQSGQHVIEDQCRLAMAAELAIGCGHAETKGGVEVFDGLKTVNFAIEAFEQAFELEDEGIFVG